MNSASYIKRCFDLARLGAGWVSPNPMVGAVLVYEDRIIGEGWHQKYGEAHAEVHCLASVKPEHKELIPYSTLYCSLEPCFHYGKTPPCVDLVLRHRIPRLVLSNLDPNPKVVGQSVAKLREAGVEVQTGILEEEGLWLNRVFFHWIRTQRPYIILKWAQSSDGFVGKTGSRTAISSPESLRLVHRWRTETDAILVGRHTALTDNPRLDTRLYPGRNPLRIVLDAPGSLPETHHLLDDSTETWVLGKARSGNFSKTSFWNIPADRLSDELSAMLSAHQKSSLLVEGGPETHRRFIQSGLWNEIRISQREDLYLGDGVPAPALPRGVKLVKSRHIGNDLIRFFV